MVKVKLECATGGGDPVDRVGQRILGHIGCREIGQGQGSARGSANGHAILVPLVCAGGAVGGDGDGGPGGVVDAGNIEEVCKGIKRIQQILASRPKPSKGTQQRKKNAGSNWMSDARRNATTCKTRRAQRCIEKDE